MSVCLLNYLTTPIWSTPSGTSQGKSKIFQRKYFNSYKEKGLSDFVLTLKILILLLISVLGSSSTSLTMDTDFEKSQRLEYVKEEAVLQILHMSIFLRTLALE